MSVPLLLDATRQFDYIIVGGGIAGSVLSRRLSDKYPSASILLLEAGGRPEGHPLIGPPLACFRAHNSELDWAYTTIPQKNLGGRKAYQAAGKVLSGGSAVNYGLWTRGSSAEYDRWAKLIGDDRWSWKTMLPFFNRVETFVPGVHSYDPANHGTDGPISVISVTSSHSERKYPLKETVAQLLESEGYTLNPDGNSGKPRGYWERWENWKDGRRQLTSVAYKVASCTNVTILTNTTVKQVLFEGKKAVGVKATSSSGETIVFSSKKDIILSAGTFRSAQLLMVSGIGPTEILKKHSIPIVHSNPQVGQNLHDHVLIPQYWKLKVANSALGGSSSLQGPAHQVGLPGDWLALWHDPSIAGIAQTEGSSPEEVSFLADETACQTEAYMSYTVAGPGTAAYTSDGMTVTTMVVGMLPTSRGTVTIASPDMDVYPIIDSNVYATEADRTAVRNVVRKFTHMLTETELGQSIIERELTEFPGTSNEAIDKRAEKWGIPFWHPAGTCSMGTVVNGDCRVIGVEGLRVIDNSILPVPICAHLQAVVYAVAERAADLL